jgi:hypothetical protein
MSDASKSVFSKLIDEPKRGRPEPEIPRGPMLRPEIPPSDYQAPPVEKLLDWLVNRWPKDTVNVQNILQFGPVPLRNRKSARPTAEILEKRGWLTLIKSRYYRQREWRIERGPSKSE